MEKMVIDRTQYRDRVSGCWLGKNIGGTLGAPWEGLRHTHGLTFYEPVPDGTAPNDDLDLQLVWLHMLEKEGTDPSIRTFADYWARCAARYPWNEYGFFMRNYERGLRPLVAGCFENYFVDEMGAPIRSEIWACLHPGDPQAAARMAWKDASLDHAGGEGVYGEMFWAAVQAAAFVEQNPGTLIRIGLSMIPLSSHLGRAIREAVLCYERGISWGVARERIATRFGHLQPCNAVPNHGFTIIGWLYGRDFGDCLCKAVNCGYDTDCTGATLGALLGIIAGRSGLPDQWLTPIGEKIVLHKFTGDCQAPRTVAELTERTIALAEKAVAEKQEISFGPHTCLPADTSSRLARNYMARAVRAWDTEAGVELLPDGREVWFHYQGEPVLRPGVAKTIAVSLPDGGPADIELAVPAGWTCTRLGPSEFSLFSPGPVAGRNSIEVITSGQRIPFTILGPDEARGYPAGDNVPSCPVCGARVEACMCPNRHAVAR